AARLAEIDLARRSAANLLNGAAQEVRHPLIHEGGPVLDIHHPDAFVGGFHQLLVARFRGAQGRLLTFALAQVAKDRHERDDLTLCVGEGRHRNPDVDERPVVSNEAGLDVANFLAAANMLQEALQGLLASRSQPDGYITSTDMLTRTA